MKSWYRLHLMITFLTALSIAAHIKAQGYISELINNTDEELIIRYPKTSSNVSVKSSFLLTDNKETQPRIQYSPFVIHVAPRTRNDISNLMIPIVTPAFSNPHDIYESSIIVDFRGKTYRNRNFHGLSNGYLIIRQCGDLFKFTPRGLKFKELQLPNGTVMDLFKLEHQEVINEKIDRKVAYSIELNASHKLSAPIDAKLTRKKEESRFMVQKKSRPIARLITFIQDANEQAIITAVVGFNQIISNDFFDKFCSLISKNKFLMRVATLNVEDKGIRLLRLNLYTKINKQEFNKLLDQLNRTQL